MFGSWGDINILCLADSYIRSLAESVQSALQCKLESAVYLRKDRDAMEF